ncbi:MAG: DUF2975 domain-containing protein [Vicinamibacterales bacterium]
MQARTSSSPALPIAHGALKLAIVLNWVMCAAILALLIAAPNRQWIMSAFDLTPFPDTDRLILALRVVASLGLVVVPLNYNILKKLIAMIETVRSGDPFVGANADRLQAIAWMLLSLQVLSMIIGAIGESVFTPAHPVNLDAGFSFNGWLAVLLTFLLARVFAEGTRMCDDLEGTV